MQASWLLTEIIARERQRSPGAEDRFRAEALAANHARRRGLRATVATTLARIGMRVDATAVRTAATAR